MSPFVSSNFLSSEVYFIDIYVNISTFKKLVFAWYYLFYSFTFFNLPMSLK